MLKTNLLNNKRFSVLPFKAVSFVYLLISVFERSTPVSGSSSIPRGVIFFGSGVNVESGLSSVLLLVIL